VGITFDLSLLFGYAAGGGLIALIGTTPALIANAASFVLSAILLSNIPAARLRPTDGALVRVRDGWRALVDDPFIRRFFVGYTVVAGCAMVGESLVAIYALEVLRRGAGLSGLLAAAIPVGAILVTVASRSRGTETAKIRRASEIALLGSLAALPIFVAGADLPLILLGFAGIGALNASRIPAIEVAVLRLDDRMRGPSFSIIQGFVLGSQAMCAALGGLVARTVGVRQAIVISLIISATVGLWGTLRPPHEIRHAVRTTTTPR
jgi:hypothetical protein